MRMTSLMLLLGLLFSIPAHAQSLELAGIAHVAFRVDSLEKSREFYRALGFEQAFEFTNEGKTAVAFIKINDRQFIELYPRTASSEAGGLLHVCFEASDIEVLRAAYVKQGLNPGEIKKFRAGNLLFVMHDPEGQLLEYTQYLPDSLHSVGRGKHLGEHRISQHLWKATATVQDIAAERRFYTSTLGFEGRGSAGGELRIPGNSGDEVELQSASPTAKPSIAFAVANVRHTAHELRSRGLKVNKTRGSVSITDPDGALIVFAAPRAGVPKP